MMNSFLMHFRKLRVDLLLGFSLFGLMFFRSAFILSASIDQYEINALFETYFFRQVVFYFVGITFGVFFVIVDYHRLMVDG